MAAKRPQKAFIASLILLSVLAAAPARAEEADEVTRSLGLSGEEPAASRLPRPASRIAENVTVVTSEEIARLNAHTAADVLQTVPGVQVELLQTPGGIVLYDVAGVTNRHVLVQIDGVPQNFVSAENLAHIGSIPVQMIERIEIVKGAASAAWGSALGGVINIITKMPATDRVATGLVSASTGKGSTDDLRGELSGSADRFGYYLTGGAIRSDGLIAGNDVDFDHGFGKLTYELPNGARATLGVDARHTDAGISRSTAYNFYDNGSVRYLNSYLSVQYPLAKRLGLELNARGGVREAENKRWFLAQQSLFFDGKAREAHQGYAAALNWGDAQNALKGGLEYERIDVRQRELVNRAPDSNSDLGLERRSAYLNGTFTLGRLSVLPGVRIETVNLLEDPVSCTLGATWRLSDGTLLRGYAARGYSMPLITYFGSTNGQVQRELQQVRTVQAGVESTAVPYLWLKGMLFNNNIWNIQSYDYQAGIMRLEQQSRRGVDLELRTSAFYGFALNGAYTFTDARNRRTGEKLDGGESGPRHAVKGGINYENRDLGLTCTLTGNYSVWHLTTPGSERIGMLWDLHATQKLSPRSENSPELFFSLRNIFNDALYQYDFRPAAPRWFELGGRLRF